MKPIQSAKILSVLIALVCANLLNAQKINSRIRMEQGAVYEVQTEVKNLLAQQVNGMSFDFNLDGSSVSQYAVTNTTDENISLRHSLQRIHFLFDGMGSKQSFDSDKPKDLEREFARPLRDMLAKSYDMIVDSLGKTLLVLSPSAAPSQGDDQYRLISSMMGELGAMATPPKKGEPTVFMAWPGGEMAVGESWTISSNAANDKYSTVYILREINDSIYRVEFSGTGTRRVENEMRGTSFVINLKTVTQGEMIVDRGTGIIKEKTSTIESTGSSELMGSSTPVTGKTTMHVKVRKL
jgi:hypothetical protein